MSRDDLDKLEKKLESVRLTAPETLDARVDRTLARARQAAAAGKETEMTTVAAHAAAVERPTGRVFTARRLLKAVVPLAAAAAAVIAAVVILSSPPTIVSAHAALIEALENSRTAAWAHWRTGLDDREYEVWMSFKPFRHVIKGSESVTYIDDSMKERWIYDAASNTITVDAYDDVEKVAAGAADLFGLFMTLLDNLENHGAEVKATSETVGGKSFQVFTVTRSDGDEVARFFVDASLQRVVKLQSTTSGTEAVTVDIDYPPTGPEDIYAVGVPRSAKIVRGSYGDVRTVYDAAKKAGGEFEPEYMAFICKGRLAEAGALEPFEVAVASKKGDHARIDYYDVPATSPQSAVQPLASFDDVFAVERWKDTKTPRMVLVGDSGTSLDPARMLLPTYRLMVRENGAVDKRQQRIGLRLELIEGLAWPLPPLRTAASNAERLPSEVGELGPLDGIECRLPAFVSTGRLAGYPTKFVMKYNPARDHICERRTTVIDAKGSWETDPDWFEEVTQSEVDREYRSVEESNIVEYAQTREGQWYPRRIISHKTRSGAMSSDEATVTVVYVDTTREIDDSVFDVDGIDFSK